MEFFAKHFQEISATELYEILKARYAIFTMEQGIVCQDMDGIDYDCLHCFLWEDGQVRACLRAFYTDKARTSVKIGRVLTMTHGLGHGQVLMERSLAAIRQALPHQHLYVHSQVRASGFYEKFGFVARGEVFDEADVPHIEMVYQPS